MLIYEGCMQMPALYLLEWAEQETEFLESLYKALENLLTVIPHT